METEEIIAAITEAANTIARPNWAAVVSAVAAIFAVAVACIVAWKQCGIAKKQNEIVLKQAKIAEQQNMIALFEKRYDVYITVKKVVDIAEEIYKISDIDDVYDVFRRTFKAWQWPGKEGGEAGYLWMYPCAKILNKIEEARYLFSEDIYEEISGLKLRLILMISISYSCDEKKEFDDEKMKFYQFSEDFKSKKVIERMESNLKLQSIEIQG